MDNALQPLILVLLVTGCAYLPCPRGQELGGTGCLCSSTSEPPVDGSCIDDVCRPDGCPCSVEGIQTAIARGGTQVIQCAEDAPPVNTTQTILIDNDVILDGQGNLTLQGDGSHLIVDVQPFVVELIGLTIQNGDQAIRVSSGATLTLFETVVRGNTSSIAPGGGIFNSGDLTLVKTSVEGNTASGSEGGGIYNDSDATLTLISSEVHSNESQGRSGGGIYNRRGTVELMDGSEIYENRATRIDSRANGAGIATMGGAVMINGSAIRDNIARDDGGGLYAEGNDSSVSIGDSTVSGNRAIVGRGGGISNERGIVVVERSSISENMAATGGGLSSTDGSAMITFTNTTVSNNEATVMHGGGAHLSFGALQATATTWSGNTAALDAGAILVEGGTAELTLEGSTVSNNIAKGMGPEGMGGGIRVDTGTAYIINSTIFFNTAFDGGALNVGPFNSGARVDIRNSTISNNDVRGRGEPGPRPSAAISHVGGTVEFTQTIIDDNCCCGPASTPPSITVSRGHNIESPDDTCQLDDATDTVGVPATALGLPDDLGDNGGPTQTLLPTEESVVVDYGPSACVETDQRGIPRPQNGQCDVGAVEVE